MNEYEPADKEALVELQGACAKLSMGDKENPKNMIVKVIQLNKWLKKVKNRYEKDEIKLITHLFAWLLAACLPVKVASQNSGIEKMDLKKVQKDLVALVCKELYDGEEQDNKKGIAIMADEGEENKRLWSSKKHHKKFKSECQKCGRAGHKAVDCYVKTKISGEKNESTGSLLLEVKVNDIIVGSN